MARGRARGHAEGGREGTKKPPAIADRGLTVAAYADAGLLSAQRVEDVDAGGQALNSSDTQAIDDLPERQTLPGHLPYRLSDLRLIPPKPCLCVNQSLLIPPTSGEVVVIDSMMHGGYSKSSRRASVSIAVVRSA